MGVKPRESGAQGRKRRKLERELAMLERARRLAAGGDRPEHLQRLATIGEPPAQVTELLPWAAKLTAELLHQVATDPLIDEDRRRKHSADLGDKLAKLLPRALLEDQVAEVMRFYEALRQPAGLRLEPTAGIRKPPTARGQRRERALRPVVETDPENQR